MKLSGGEASAAGLAASMAAAIVKTALSVQETTVGEENAHAEDIH